MTEKQTKGLSRKVQGQETRATLIDTGARLFAQQGYNGVSMRALAAEAEVNLATVSYHFGGKAGLYEAIIDEIIAVRDEIFPTCEEVEARMNKAGRDTAAKAQVVDWFVGQLIREIVSEEAYVWPTVIISRELSHPTELYPKLEKHFFNPSFAALCALVTHTVPKDTPKEEIMITAHSIIGMIIKLLEGKTLLLKRLEWPSFSDNIDTLISIMTKRIKGFLGLPMENA